MTVPVAGTMQRHELTVGAFLDHAARWHDRAGVVTASEADADFTSYGDVRRRVGLLASAFRKRGVGRGDVVATLGWNTQGHVETWYAAAGVGAVCHTLNPRLTAAQLSDMISRSRPRILLHGCGLDGLATDLARAAPGRPRLMALEGDQPSTVSRAIAVETEDGIDGHTREDDPVGLCFTSGTTGEPKGVLYTHRSNHLHTLRLLQADALGLTASDRVLAAVPMFHANGWGLPYAAPAVGATLVLPGRHVDGASLARLVAEQDVTIAAGVPTVWLDLADHVERTGTPLPALRRVYLGGAALPSKAQRRLEEVLGASVHTSWGMTELSPLGTVAPEGVGRTPAGSSGRPPMGLDMRLVDDDGRALPRPCDAEGRLQVRGHGVVRRYYGADGDAIDAEGWFDTGDLARIACSGDLTITGRAKDLIKSGGEWINPAEIEMLVGGLAGVSLAAVIARPDPRWGERPILVVELSPGASITDGALAVALEGGIARWWMPDAIHRVERMPLAATGKIDKAELRRRFSTAEVATASSGGA